MTAFWFGCLVVTAGIAFYCGALVGKTKEKLEEAERQRMRRAARRAHG